MIAKLQMDHYSLSKMDHYAWIFSVELDGFDGNTKPNSFVWYIVCYVLPSNQLILMLKIGQKTQ